MNSNSGGLRQTLVKWRRKADLSIYKYNHAYTNQLRGLYEEKQFIVKKKRIEENCAFCMYDLFERESSQACSA